MDPVAPAEVASGSTPGDLRACGSRQMQALIRASLALTTELSLEGVLQKIADAARDVLQARYAALTVLDESGTTLTHFVTSGIDEATRQAIGALPTHRGLVGRLIAAGRPLRIPLAAAHPRSVGFPPHHPHMGSFLGVPVTVRDQAYGNLYVTEKEGAPEFSEADEALAQMLAAQAGVAIENAMTFQALRRVQSELKEKDRQATELAEWREALVRASLALTMDLPLEGVLQKIADAARDVLQARYAALGAINESGTGLSQFVTAGLDEATKEAIGALPTGRGVLGQLIKDRRPLRIRDLALHPASAEFPPNHLSMGSFLGVPITVRDKDYGTLYVTEKEGAPEFSDADEALARMLAAQAGIAIENAQTFAALREAQEELVRQERLATLGQLAGGVGHELRNPLGVIKNSVYYLDMILPKDDKVQKHLGILNREVAACNRIVTELLEFARLKAAHRAPTSLAAVAREGIERLGAPPSIVIRLDLDESLPPVLADPQHAAQIVINLLTNAVQAMPDGGTLTVTADRSLAGLFISIEDTGSGIAPENLAKIFQPLFTTKAKGIGLGLALVRDLVELNGGSIAVDSAPSRGSRFVVTFAEAARA